MSEFPHAPTNPGAVPDGCLGCARLEDPAAPTVTLLSGAVVCTWCEAWRQECFDRQQEAYAVLALRDRPARQAYLARREAALGTEYRRRLEAVILQTWEARRRAAPAP